jgi:hypothetical protein
MAPATDLDFSAKHKAASLFDIDQLRLEKDERARILIMDQKVKMVPAHYIRSGEVTSEGYQRGRYYACLGDYERVMADGKDPDKCPACRVADATRDSTVSMPRRRFVLNIVRYRTNSRGQLATPISLAHELWVFGDDKFNRLVDRAEEHGDLRTHDLLLTCTAKQYQNYDIDVGAKAMVQSSPEAAAQYKELKSKRPADVERILANVITYEAMERLVADATPQIAMDLADDTSSIADVASVLDDEVGTGETTVTFDEPQRAATTGDTEEADFSALLEA